MSADPLAFWIRFLASPAAPATALRPVELEGFLVGIILAPDVVTGGTWLGGLWGGGDPVFDSREQLQRLLDGIMTLHNGLIARIDREGKDFRPLYMDEDGKPDLDRARLWVSGFRKAMALAPASWAEIAEDEETGVLLEPFVSFVDADGLAATPPRTSPDDLRRSCAELIPVVMPLLRSLGQARTRIAPGRRPAAARPNVGRNDPCSCGSGRKYKRCCGLN